jgi:hypothetical protein
MTTARFSEQAEKRFRGGGEKTVSPRRRRGSGVGPATVKARPEHERSRLQRQRYEWDVDGIVSGTRY